MQNLEYEIVGAVKIKDGLFLGDEYAAQDLEFVVTNKVSRIINCAAKQIPNHWETIGVYYMSYGWLETDNQIIFDPKDEVLNSTFKFIEETLNAGDSILVHSVRGHNRACCIIAAYMMRKFRWTLYKTLEFLHSRKPDLEIRASFFNQLLNLENRLAKIGLGAKTFNWKEINDENQFGDMENEEVLLSNTFLNSKMQPMAEFQDLENKEYETRVRWVDGNEEQNQKVVTLLIPVYESCEFKKKRESKHLSIKSIIKGSDKTYNYLQQQIKQPFSEDEQKANISQKGKEQIQQQSQLAQSATLVGKTGSVGMQRQLKMKQKLEDSENQNEEEQQDYDQDLELGIQQDDEDDVRPNKKIITKYSSQKDFNKRDIDNNYQVSSYSAQKPMAVISNRQNFGNVPNEDLKLQNSLNNIANKQLKDAFAFSLNSDTVQEMQQFQHKPPKSSVAARIYGQNNIRKITKKELMQLVQDGKPAVQLSNKKFSSGKSNSLVVDSTKQRQKNFAIDPFEDKFMNQQKNNYDMYNGGGSNNSGKQFSFENNFKNTQKIYSAPIMNKPPAVNNFLTSAQPPTQSQKGYSKTSYEHFGLKINNIDPKFSQPDYQQQSDNGKIKKKMMQNYGRPSTAPLKSKENNNNPNNNGNYSRNQGMYTWNPRINKNLEIQQNASNNINFNNTGIQSTGNQRQSSVQPKQIDDSAQKSKMRSSSPGNVYANSFNMLTSNKPKWKFQPK